MGEQYLIWSIEHTAWWRPGRVGYTQVLAEAGRYTFDEAREIVEDANVAQVNECWVPAACVSNVTATVVHLLVAGQAVCGRPGTPDTWLAHEQWVSRELLPDVTCAACRLGASLK